MCIALLATSHPEYPFILLNNRDEFLSRPTLDADWWEDPNSDVLGGRDAQRLERGTWLGITKTGRIAVLTNFREEGVEVTHEKSRGAIPSAWLTGQQHKGSPEEFASKLINETGIHDVGGFSLLFGSLRAPDAKGQMSGLRVLSNRSLSANDLQSIATSRGETHGLSNSHFGDASWPKVVQGEKLLEHAIKASVERGDDSPEELLERLFRILSVDRLRQRKEGESWEVYVRQMRNSILIPPLKGQLETAGVRAGVDGSAASPERVSGEVNGGGGAGYGTQKQTVVLVDRKGHVMFVERTLYDEEGGEIEREEGERRFEFDIDGWHG